MPNLAKTAAAPLRRYFNPRFEALAEQVSAVQADVARVATVLENRAITPTEVERLRQADQLERIDVSELNRTSAAPTFDGRQSRAVSAGQCESSAYREWFSLLEDRKSVAAAATTTRPDGTADQHYSRKVWEWACIAEAAKQAGVLSGGRRALGFGVGNEPLPAYLASTGMEVVATDQELSTGQEWADTNQLMSGLADLSRPHLLPDEELAARVTTRAVDMNHVPDDLGTFDLIWSACCLEHLGTPRLGLDFVERTSELLAPGGVSVHTTELELTARTDTADYGHCAVYRGQDLLGLRDRLVARGMEVDLNLYVSLDTPQDRWVSMVLSPGETITLADRAHLKLVIGESVSTSYVLIVRRPG